jgi:hypothetical protein
MHIRSRSAAACAATVAAFALTGCFPTLPNFPNPGPPDPPIVPLSDDASMKQVIEPAKQFAQLNELEDVSGGFGWVACGGQNEALYYGQVEMSFLLPKGIDEKQYIRQIAKTMVANGWTDGPPRGDRSFGTLVHTDHVRAIITGGNFNVRERGAIQLLAQCRNTNDHRDDSVGVNITDQLRQR